MKLLLQVEVSATKARAVKLDNYTRRENIWLLNVPKSQGRNCKEILRGVMAAVKMEGANKGKLIISQNKEMTESLVQGRS